MKFGTVLVAGLSCVLLSACASSSGANKKKEVVQEAPASIQYSNLLDQKTRSEVEKQLLTVLPKENVERFLSQVVEFNETIPTDSLAQQGFETSKKLIPAYDVGQMTEKWLAKYPVFPGYNCRLTTFQLLKNNVMMTAKESFDDSLLFIDREALSQAPKSYQLTPEEDKQFRVMFSAVDTENVSDIQVHVKHVQQYWQSQGLEFKTGSAKMISVWLHDQLDEKQTKLFIGHVGLLVPTDNGYFFVEKISFEEPYQVLKFENKQAVNNYLMAKYDVDKTGLTKPFIMENDKLMSEYAVLKSTK